MYLLIPVIFLLPLSLNVKIGSASIGYFLSWGLTLIGFCFTGREGYERIKFAVKGFLRKEK